MSTAQDAEFIARYGSDARTTGVVLLELSCAGRLPEFVPCSICAQRTRGGAPRRAAMIALMPCEVLTEHRTNFLTPWGYRSVAVNDCPALVGSAAREPIHMPARPMNRESFVGGHRVSLTRTGSRCSLATRP